MGKTKLKFSPKREKFEFFQRNYLKNIKI